MGTTKTATGPFHVEMKLQTEAPGVSDPAVGRFALDKVYRGDFEGAGKGQMLGVRSAVKGSGGYVAMEVVAGTLAGKSGSFILQHSSTMVRGTPTQSITVVPDSGEEGLVGLTGSMTIEIKDGGQHFYVFEYGFDAAPPA